MSGRYDPSTRADAKLLLDDRGYTGHLIRGQAPHLLFEEAVRNRVVTSLYWQEQCFGLNAATLCDRAAELRYIGGTFRDGRTPTPFLCLAFKMLQLGVGEDILGVYLNEGGEEWKYLRALAAFYVRLTGERSEGVYALLEPLLGDYRKLVRRGNRGDWLTTVDAFVDELLTKERVCATSLWKLVPREQLEDDGKLEERVSLVAHLLLEEEEGEEEEGEEEEGEEEEEQDERGDGLVNGDSGEERDERESESDEADVEMDASGMNGTHDD